MKHVYQPIQSLLKKSSSCFHHLIAGGALSLLPLFASAQAPLVANNPYTQDFNSLTNSVTATWQNNQTLPGWYVQQDAKTPALITPNNGSNINTELFSFGVGSSSDRSLGGISSVSAGKFVYVLRLVNNTGQQVTKLNVLFDLVQFYNNPGASERFGVSYKTTNIASTIANKELHTNTGWTIVNDKIKTPSKGRPGVRPATDSKSFSLDIENLNLAAGEEILIRFEDAMNTKNKGLNAIGIDNIKVYPNTTASAATIYHFVGDSNGPPAQRSDLTIPGNWNTKKDGTGAIATNFTNPFQTFIIDVAESGNGNRPETQDPTLPSGQTWTVSGIGSKVVLGDESSLKFELTLEPNSTFTGTIDLKGNSTFNIDNSNNFDANLVAVPVIEIDLVEQNSIVNYRGDANVRQYISEADYYTLNVSGSAVKYLYGSSSAITTLGLNAAQIHLNDFDLSVGNGTSNPGQITRTSGYLITAGTGSLQRFIPTGSSAVFPVAAAFNNQSNGAPFYIPATVAQNGTADLISVRAIDGYYANYTADFEPDGDRINQEVVNRTWVVEEDLVGGSDINLTVEWNSTIDQTPLFNYANSLLNYFGGAEWFDIFKSSPAPVVNNLRQMTGSNLTALGVFGVGNPNRGNTVLPVEFLSFNATRVNSQVELKWSTASEKENEYFTIEQSGDGYTFSEVAKVKGAGNSNRKLDYSFVHKNAPARLNYYRLKQTDFDGTTSYSKIVAVDGKQGATALSVYPNPGAGRFTLAGVNELLNATVVDATGRTVKTLTSLDTDYSFDLSDQKAGIYFLRLTTGNEVKTLRLIKK